MSFGFMESTLYQIVNYQIVKSLLAVNATWIIWLFVKFSTWFPTESSVQFSSVAQSYLTLCNPMNRSTPGLPVTNHLLAMKTQKSQLDVPRWGEACLTEPCCLPSVMEEPMHDAQALLQQPCNEHFILTWPTQRDFNMLSGKTDFMSQYSNAIKKI